MSPKSEQTNVPNVRRTFGCLWTISIAITIAGVGLPELVRGLSIQFGFGYSDSTWNSIYRSGFAIIGMSFLLSAYSLSKLVDSKLGMLAAIAISLISTASIYMVLTVLMAAFGVIDFQSQ